MNRRSSLRRNLESTCQHVDGYRNNEGVVVFDGNLGEGLSQAEVKSCGLLEDKIMLPFIADIIIL